MRRLLIVGCGDVARRMIPQNLLSFMQESRRLVNRPLKQELRCALRYPTAEQGIAAAREARQATGERREA
jgi:hypothetical protein